MKDHGYTLEVRESDQELISSRFFRGLVYLGCSGYLDRRNITRREYGDKDNYYYHLVDTFSLGNLVRGLEYLKSDNILNQENFEDITRKRFRAVAYAQVFRILYSAGILIPENRELVAYPRYRIPTDMAEALLILHRAHILTPENRQLVASHDYLPISLARVMVIFHSAGMLTSENLRELASTDSRKLLTEDAWDIVWHRIPRHSLTQVNINRLFYATKFYFSFDNDRYSNIRDAANWIINNPLPRARVATVVNFNNGQSTHTASVHQTVSQSATKLLTSYGSHLDLETTIANIKKYVQGLDNSPKNAAAKRCIEQITAVHYTFSDRTSGVSIRQLLALAWLAIHDSSKYSASLDDGLALLIDGLYEIQRGYNLGEHGEDNGKQDSPICSAGTFNKLIEKLNGVHQDVAVYYITHEGALSKFPKLVLSHAKAYLSRLAEPKDAILSAIEKARNITPIWGAIKDVVIAELWDEFKAAYRNNRLDTRFTSLIEYWADDEVDVTEYCTQIKAPELAQVSLFSAQVEDGGQVLSSAYSSQNR